jgi:hypothetical protein
VRSQSVRAPGAPARGCHWWLAHQCLPLHVGCVILADEFVGSAVRAIPFSLSPQNGPHLHLRLRRSRPCRPADRRGAAGPGHCVRVGRPRPPDQNYRSQGDHHEDLVRPRGGATSAVAAVGHSPVSSTLMPTPTVTSTLPTMPTSTPASAAPACSPATTIRTATSIWTTSRIGLRHVDGVCVGSRVLLGEHVRPATSCRSCLAVFAWCNLG